MPPLSDLAWGPTSDRNTDMLPESVLCKAATGLEGRLGDLFLSSMQQSRADTADQHKSGRLLLVADHASKLKKTFVYCITDTVSRVIVCKGHDEKLGTGSCFSES
jgi:hypothetical protein